MTGLKKHLDSELKNRDRRFCIQKSDIQAVDLKQKITLVLRSNFTKVESTLKDGVEFDTTVQEDFEEMQKLRNPDAQGI